MAVTAEGDAAPELDLTPRDRSGDRRRTLGVTLALVAIAGVLVFIVIQALGNASLFFLNVDEAVEQRSDLGDDRFRMQGTVVPGSVQQVGDAVDFEVTFDGAVAKVSHQGDPPELFRPDIPVVIEGEWSGDTFTSDRILVKHSSEYEADNGDRLQEADEQTDAR